MIVLDGFEVAQHARRRDELWTVLDLVLAGAPAVPVVVSGRAPVPDLRLGGRRRADAVDRAAARAAEAWLRSRGIDDPAALAAILRVADGVPLLLKLAVRLTETGGDVADVPDRLRRDLVDGYLYQRILDRVVDHRLRPLAHDALVLRRLTADVLTGVLGDLMPDGLAPAAAIAQLGRELALVESVDPPTVPRCGCGPRCAWRRCACWRSRTSSGSGSIDRRAAAWYAGPGAAAGDAVARVVAAAEAVYHYVRSGDVDGARVMWRPECAPLLAGADEDVPEEFVAARDWLAASVAALLSRTKNPFFEHGEAEYFLAERNGEVVGRIAAISNRLHNETHGDLVGLLRLLRVHR